VSSNPFQHLPFRDHGRRFYGRHDPWPSGKSGREGGILHGFFLKQLARRLRRLARVVQNDEIRKDIGMKGHR
jgi:hypothetical protein